MTFVNLQPEDNGSVSRGKLNDNFTDAQSQIDTIVAAGVPLATTTVFGRSKLSVAPVDAADPIVVGDNDTRLPSADLQAAQAGGGDFGTPSGSNKFLTEDYIPQLQTIPEIVSFTTSGTWTKDAGLKYIEIEVQAKGGNGGSAGTSSSNSAATGGGGGGYARKKINASSLGNTETVTIGGGVASFGTHVSCSDGAVGASNLDPASTNVGPVGGSATDGDINIPGGRGGSYSGGTSVIGGFAFFGTPATPQALDGEKNGQGYGAGGGAGHGGTGRRTGGAGAPAIIIVTEYYS